MKFAHLADCHIGGWREDKLSKLSLKSFEEAINICIKEKVGFILISGDLFNTSLPSIEILKEVTNILRRLKEEDINMYVIPGSHDYSISGKTMIDVLEKAGLLENVVKFKQENDKIILDFITDKTNVKIAGLFGKRLGLEKSYYELLDKERLEKEEGFKIFMFHSALEEFKPKDLEKMEAYSYELLPKNFSYYAGGHVHYLFDKNVKDYGLINYPGALFPNNFKELEEFKHGNFSIVDDKLNIRRINVKLKEVDTYNFDANEKDARDIEKEILGTIKDVKDKIITIRVEGCLKSGKVSDINFKEIFNKFNDAYYVLKNTNKLTSKEFERFDIKKGSIEEIEEGIIKDVKIREYNNEFVINLISGLFKEKFESETNKVFENRIIEDIIEIFKISEIMKDDNKQG